VWQLALTPASQPSVDDLGLLSADELARVRRLQRPADRARAVATRAALRRVLGEHTGMSPASLQFAANSHGKPALVGPTRAGGGDRAVEFNVSHAGAFALIALSIDGPVGVDIERRNAAIDLVSLMPHVLSPLELSHVGNTTRIGFFERWTAKEAALKALGVGIAAHLQALSVLPASNDDAYELHATWDAAHHIRAWPLPAPMGYAAALARAQPATA
jgi:4'-phosphopantetheinyl transferase